MSLPSKVALPFGLKSRLLTEDLGLLAAASATFSSSECAASSTLWPGGTPLPVSQTAQASCSSGLSHMLGLLPEMLSLAPALKTAPHFFQKGLL